MVKNPPAKAGDTGDSSSILGQGDPLEWELATHSSILAWRIPWMEESGGLQSTGSQRVGHDFTFTFTRGKQSREQWALHSHQLETLG